MPDIGLSPQQLAVICALSSGVTVAAAAEDAGVHRNTIANWRRNLLPFQRALADAQYDRALYFREKMEDLVELAIQSIQQILADPKTPPSVRLKAALAIIQTAATPPEPKKQVELLIETVVCQNTPPPPHKNAQPPAPPQTSPDPTPSPASPPDPPIAHKDAQRPAQTPAPDTARRTERARNAKCPCGSGKKYKRCCLESSSCSARNLTASAQN